jgi:redox-sensitive bicupin YhaK (pirin superfamily)
MVEIRPAAGRGHADHGWLNSFHSFSFGSYHDATRMGFGPLRVINDDRIAPGSGFGTHGHRDMEIISYVLEGALAHQDSMGNGSVIRPGDVQRMSAGRGVMHSEFNHDKAGQTHFLQIWIEPSERGIDPGYEERHFDAAARRGRLALIASPDGAQASVRLHQDARLFAGLFDGDESAELAIAPGRRLYVHVCRGSLMVDGQRLATGDAAAITDQTRIALSAGHQAEVLVFDLP